MLGEYNQEFFDITTQASVCHIKMLGEYNDHDVMVLGCRIARLVHMTLTHVAPVQIWSPQLFWRLV